MWRVWLVRFVMDATFAMIMLILSVFLQDHVPLLSCLLDQIHQNFSILSLSLKSLDFILLGRESHAPWIFNLFDILTFKSFHQSIRQNSFKVSSHLVTNMMILLNPLISDVQNFCQLWKQILLLCEGGYTFEFWQNNWFLENVIVQL